MSVIKAILFYSKHDEKSFRMKKVLDSVEADIDSVSVDSYEVRDRLLEDDKYGIDEVPAVLVLYSTGQHKTYKNKNLDEWFNQLLQNIQEYQMQLQTQSHPQQFAEPQESDYTVLNENVPKVLRRKPSNTVDIPSGLPSPGKPMLSQTSLIDDQDGVSIGSSGMGGIGDIGHNAAIMTEHIKGAKPSIPITSDAQLKSRKEVKADGISAAEMAKKIAEQRENYEEKLEEQRPFL